MAVYVDNVAIPFGRMIMCHMWADSDNELIAMAKLIGVNTKWIQGHPELSFGKHRNASWVHFDISSNKRQQAIQFGAIITDKYGPSEHTSKIKLKNIDPKIRAQGEKMLVLIQNARNRM